MAMDMSVMLSCTALKMKPFSPIDFTLIRYGKIIAFLEVKWRQDYSVKKIADLGGYMLSRKKYDAMKSLSLAAKLPVYFSVYLSDGLYYAIIHNVTYVTEGRGGRRDRNDKKDIERVVYIPMGNFHKVRHFTPTMTSKEFFLEETQESFSV
jgi:hypothetical protein